MDEEPWKESKEKVKYIPCRQRKVILAIPQKEALKLNLKKRSFLMFLNPQFCY
jgi:hypothetical protein